MAFHLRESNLRLQIPLVVDMLLATLYDMLAVPQVHMVTIIDFKKDVFDDVEVARARKDLLTFVVCLVSTRFSVCFDRNYILFRCPSGSLQPTTFW